GSLDSPRRVPPLAPERVPARLVQVAAARRAARRLVGHAVRRRGLAQLASRAEALEDPAIRPQPCNRPFICRIPRRLGGHLGVPAEAQPLEIVPEPVREPGAAALAV